MKFLAQIYIYDNKVPNFQFSNPLELKKLKFPDPKNYTDTPHAYKNTYIKFHENLLRRY